jgi:hypothetical protein
MNFNRKNPKERAHLENVVVDGRIIIKLILQELGDLMRTQQEPVARSCKYGYKPSGLIKGGKILA